MIELHQYPGVWGLPSLSPFCIKVEAYLRHMQIPNRKFVELNPASGPKGKMPFIRDGKNIIADSGFIIDHFENSLARIEFSRKGSPRAATENAYQRMIEEHLYFILLYSRWIDDRGFQVLKGEFKSLFPRFVGSAFLRYLRYKLKRQAYEQGIGRHSEHEVYALGYRDLQTLSLYLGENEFFGGVQWSRIDATAYGFLITILKSPIKSRLQKDLLSFENLVRYCEREERRLFPDFADLRGLTP